MYPLSEIDGDRELFLSHPLRSLFFHVSTDRKASSHYLNIVNPYVDIFLLHADTRTTQGGHNPAPVRILTIKGGLYQVGVGNGPCRCLSILMTGCPFYFHINNFGGAFPIPHNQGGQLIHNVGQPCLEPLKITRG